MRVMTIKCSGIILYNNKGKILLEDRRRIKKHGEHWSFFGGSIKEGETKEEALVREVKEELNYDLTNYHFMSEYRFSPRKDLNLIYYMYAAPLPVDARIEPHEKAGMKFFTKKQALRLKIISMDKQIIEEFFKTIV